MVSDRKPELLSHVRFQGRVDSFLRFTEAKMNAKAVVVASRRRRGAAAIVDAKRRPRGNYHNFIISSFQGSCLEAETFKRASNTLPSASFLSSFAHRPAGCFSSSADGFVSFALGTYVQIAPTTFELFKQLERITHAYLFNKILSFIPRNSFLLILSLKYC